MFRCTLREIGLIVLVAGLVLGWIIDHRRLRAEAEHWTNYTYAVGMRLEDHGEFVSTRDRETFQVYAADAPHERYDFFSVSRGKFYPAPPIPLPSNDGTNIR